MGTAKLVNRTPRLPGKKVISLNLKEASYPSPEATNFLMSRNIGRSRTEADAQPRIRAKTPITSDVGHSLPMRSAAASHHVRNDLRSGHSRSLPQTRCDESGRFRYTLGSEAAGTVIY
jgi:hypothetical protein